MNAELRKVVREVIEATEKGGPAEAKAGAERLRPLLPPGRPHVGKTSMKPEEGVEWYAGEFVNIVDNELWFAMNSFINCLDKFCP